MKYLASKRIKLIPKPQRFEFCQSKTSSRAGSSKEISGGCKRSRTDRLIDGVGDPQRKRRKRDCKVNRQGSSSGRVFNQPLDPKALKKNPMDDETSMINQPLSPKNLSRAALRKNRYADIILNSQQQLVHDHPVKTQQEYEELERSLAEDKDKIRAAEAAAKKNTKVELKKQREREREREAARIALQQMGRTAGIELNLEVYKELEILCGWSLSRGNPLPELGLFIKEEYLGEQDEEEAILYEEVEDKEKIRAAEAAAKKKTKVELKKQRERQREREAARIAMQKMEGTAGIELNLEIFKELEILSGCSLSLGKPLQELGLFIKQEYLGDDDEENLKVEHGKILTSGSKVVDDGLRKNSSKAQPCRNSSSLPKKSKSSEQEKVVKVALNARVTSQMSKFDVPHSGERLLTPISDAQMTPEKDCRAAMLKSRYANIILKSQQQIVDPVKTQREYEKLKRRLAEDKAKIRAAKAAAKEKTKVELKKQREREREREREAARIALQKMEGTAGIELNLEIFKELEILSGCFLSIGKPLQELGLFTKQEYLGDEDEEEAILYEEVEEGEILPQLKMLQGD